MQIEMGRWSRRLKILREWKEVAAFAARQSFLMLVTSLRLRIRKTPPREWPEVFVSAPDSNRLHSVYETDALPNELACDFRPIAWCKLKWNAAFAAFPVVNMAKPVVPSA
jgi:hypothetical protein